jgi:hypothetical protein
MPFVPVPVPVPFSQIYIKVSIRQLQRVHARTHPAEKSRYSRPDFSARFQRAIAKWREQLGEDHFINQNLMKTPLDRPPELTKKGLAAPSSRVLT